jgi:putative membrane protein
MNKNIKTALIIGGVIITIAIVVLFGSGAGVTSSPLFFLLSWGLVMWGIVALVRGLSQPSGSDSVSSRPDSALEVLKKRYARGEINKEEYEEKKKDLE